MNRIKKKHGFRRKLENKRRGEECKESKLECKSKGEGKRERSSFNALNVSEKFCILYTGITVESGYYYPLYRVPCNFSVAIMARSF